MRLCVLRLGTLPNMATHRVPVEERQLLPSSPRVSFFWFKLVFQGGMCQNSGARIGSPFVPGQQRVASNKQKASVAYPGLPVSMGKAPPKGCRIATGTTAKSQWPALGKALGQYVLLRGNDMQNVFQTTYMLASKKYISSGRLSSVPCCQGSNPQLPSCRCHENLPF